MQSEPSWGYNRLCMVQQLYGEIALKGYVQVYTGDGKGKTTATLGLCLRSVGAGLKVYFGQFLKKGRYSEHKALEKFADLITVRQFGTPGFIFGEPTGKDIAAAEAGLLEVMTAISSGSHDVVVLDEINVAIHYRLVPVDRVLSLIKAKPEDIELILTGRYAHDEILAAADLVTEMRLIKHYHEAGVSARKGIEH